MNLSSLNMLHLPCFMKQMLFMASPYLIRRVSLATLFSLDLAIKGTILVKERRVSPRHLSSLRNLYLELNSSRRKSLQQSSIAFLSKTISLVFSLVFIVNGYFTLSLKMYCKCPKISPDPTEQKSSWSSPAYFVFFLSELT